ncbi:MAG: capsule assembly Wzi family protein [Candidatus Binatus sp.]|uniref:capsule assembly Wzi family protein n=1 Tax=Candidatus Binatus sp. TaxID=2811406 RepID=UPI0027216D3E|nr:capsule assembly Wzi family protein [Candidatus Binatus sp.]MDO8432767.1 capsule assembly Wzi family protein [Candidatus Binatus sp.]
MSAGFGGGGSILRFQINLLVLAAFLAAASSASASTYAAYVPLDDPAYMELETLSGLGLIQTYLNEIKPIARVEVARLILEAQQEQSSSLPSARLAASLIRSLRLEFAEEVSWLEHDREDYLPTMLKPIERVEGQYIFSSGGRRSWLSSGGNSLSAKELTPLLPDSDGIPTAPGSNEVARLAGWGGVGGFLTFYGEGGVAGPMTRSIPGTNRFRVFSAATVLSLGNTAISFGKEETAWGVSHFGLGSLSQGNNGQPFAALRLQNIHPSVLPFFLKYLGQERHVIIFGQLDSDRTFSRPWISGQTVSFKPFPFFEFGVNHVIMFGGSGNSNYGFGGFLGRATGFATGNAKDGNTNSRVGFYAKLIVPQLRNTQFYYEILGEDFFQPFGNSLQIKTPFKAPSYTFGIYAPQLTADGLTDAGAEYTLLDSRYSTHNDSLYWVYQNNLMGDPLGPGAWHVNAQIGRWFNYQTKLGSEFFFERRSMLPFQNGSVLVANENGFGGAFTFLHIPAKFQSSGQTLGQVRLRLSAEYVENLNYSSRNSVRTMLELSFGVMPSWPSLKFR